MLHPVEKSRFSTDDQSISVAIPRELPPNGKSFFRTLKREEVDAKEFRDLEELRLNITAFIDRYYNQERLHSALGYRPPAEFERVTESSDAASISTASKIDVATGAAQSSVELQFVSQLSRSRLSQRGVRLVDLE